MSEHQHIERILTRLRSQIRGYVCLEGGAALVAVLCGLFWLTFTLDLLHFQARKLELPGWFRTGCLLLMVGITVAAALSWIVLRVFRSLRARALALLLERRFPELDDRLITAVELLDQQGTASPLQSAMQARTLSQAAQLAEKIQLSDVFDRQPLRRQLTVASVLIVTVLVFAVTNAQAMGRWVNAFLLGKADYWEPFRQSEFEVYVVAQPGDRRRDFDAQGHLKHPRGADLELVAVTREGKPAPAKATLQYLNYGSSSQRGRVTLSRQGEGEFRHTLQRVLDDHELWLTAGDYVNRLPFRIDIVDPPRVDRLALACDFPTYVGRDGEEDRLLEVVGTQVSLPMETAFELQGTVNKPLQELHVRSQRFELHLVRGQTAGQLTVIDPETEAKRLVTIDVPAETFAADGLQFSLPLHLAATGAQKLKDLGESTTFPLSIPSDAGLQLDLRDVDEIDSPESANISLNGIVDLEPVVDARLKGISSVITRTASIPFEGRILDDYGVTRAWFGYRIDKNEQLAVRELVRQPANVREFQLEPLGTETGERFNVLPLELKEGQTLTLGMYAEDGDTLNGPHQGHGELFSFTIVSTEELLARLYDREVNLRLRFEQLRDEVFDLRKSLIDQLALLPQLENSATEAAQRDKLLVAQGAFAERALHQLRKNHTESRSVELGFRDLREELVNNRADTKDYLDRIDGGVLAPLQILNAEEFGTADERLGNFRLVHERQGNREEALTAADIALEALLARMDAILAEMRDRGTFNEFIQQLQQLIEEQRKLRQETEQKRNENFFNDLGN